MKIKKGEWQKNVKDNVSLCFNSFYYVYKSISYDAIHVFPLLSPAALIFQIHKLHWNEKKVAKCEAIQAWPFPKECQ